MRLRSEPLYLVLCDHTLTDYGNPSSGYIHDGGRESAWCLTSINNQIYPLTKVFYDHLGAVRRWRP